MKKKAPEEKVMNYFTKTPKYGKTHGTGAEEIQEVATFRANISCNCTVSRPNFGSNRGKYLKEKELFLIEKFFNDIKFTEIGDFLSGEIKSDDTFMTLLSELACEWKKISPICIMITRLE